jgi:lysophospholipase L1-like esterase
MKRFSLYLNILFLIALVSVIYKEDYVRKLKQKIFSDNSLQHYKNRPAYKDQLLKYGVYSKQANIVMLGTSLTQDIDWNELMNRGDIVNRGYGGDLIAVMADRLPYIIPVHPKICFIEGGINDIDNNIPLHETLQHLINIIDTLQKNSITPILTAATHVTNNAYQHTKRNKQIKEFNTELKKLAKVRGLTVIDKNLVLAPDGYLKNEFSKYDGLHYLPKTYLIWKAEIEKILQQQGL